ncbi:adenylate/guanylate cyclase domain-containing protein [Gordonia sp. HY285]|uniref:adenylate/guanylate cyclase domain-containing protein n=1 Tax=Gordonia liuliyuniae TaxID=2911517 RepID=UPI001F2A4BFE|nr:adenylate/guanylate cyclase domain-containing protein [Gordonia liuliyuniae]MCF8608777.1 adenylate/guanylate cyclase domain-containing protein [Gordonia liuliyuniae]
MTAPSSDARYSRDELVEALGIDPEYGEKIWTAFGFARQHSDAKLFSDADVAAFRLFARGAAQVDEAAQIATARTIGQSLARLADWQADQLTEFDQDPDVTWSINDMAKALNRIQQLVWRLHLEIALEGSRSSHTDHADWNTVIGFVDVVGYTSLSRQIDHHELNDLITAFEDRISAVVTRYDGQVIKTLGDGILFANPDPASSALTALDIADLSDEPPIPRLRIGLAHGEVLARLGDVFGEPVNIAARLCGSARPGKILIDENLADAIEDDDRVRLRSIPPLSVRGYRRLRAHALSRPKP